jgi:hypothetical protein
MMLMSDHVPGARRGRRLIWDRIRLGLSGKSTVAARVAFAATRMVSTSAHMGRCLMFSH